MGGRSVFPSGVIRYSTATGRELSSTRSTIPFLSSLRSVAVRDFWVKFGRRGIRHETWSP